MRHRSRASQRSPGNVSVRPSGNPLQLISDAARVGEAKFFEALEAALRAGLRRVQLREPAWDPERFEAFVKDAADFIRNGPWRDALILVSRRADLVDRLGLDGVHVGGGKPEDVRAARAAVRAGSIVGYSAHSIEEILEAARQGADYVSYSPIFGSLSKRHPLEPVGIEGLRRACSASPIPVYALGGILPEHAAEIRRAGAAGAAMIGGILDAADPAAAVRGFLEGWASVGESTTRTLGANPASDPDRTRGTGAETRPRLGTGTRGSESRP